MAVDTICSDLEAQENKVCHCFYCFPIYLPWMGPDAMILVFWMLSFKPVFFTLLFHLIKKFFSSSSLSAIRVVSSAYLRLLIFLLAILIPACALSSPTFRKRRSWHLAHHFMGNRWENSGNSDWLYFRGSKITADVTAAMKLKDAYSLEGKLWPT